MACPKPWICTLLTILLLPSKAKLPSFSTWIASGAKIHSRSARIPLIWPLLIFLASPSDHPPHSLVWSSFTSFTIHCPCPLLPSHTFSCLKSSIFPITIPEQLYLSPSRLGLLEHPHSIPFFFLTLKTTVINSFPFAN